jgi:hypothetical protein
MAIKPQQARRQALAEQRAATVRAERRRSLMMATGSVIAVIAGIAVIVVVGLNAGGKSGKTGDAASPQLMTQITTVPATVAEGIGAGSGAMPQPLTGDPAPITKDGKPYVLYVGGEFCPFCAAERWSIVEALSRFGTFTHMGTTFSAPSPEAYPDTATLSFHRSSYSSDVLAFEGVEAHSNKNRGLGRGWAALDKLTPDQEKLFATYSPRRSYPFLLIGNKYVSLGTFDVGVLQGKTHDEIATAMHDPSSPIAQAVVGTANYLTAAICETTGNAPANVCTTPVITKLQGELKAQK